MDLSRRRSRITAVRLALLALAALLLAVPAALAKDFHPGDLRLCDRTRCLAIRDQAALDAVSRFYYGRPQPARATAPRNGARMYRLSFPNGYVSGFVAGSALDRFLSGGVNLDQFSARVWYRMPPVAAAALRRLARDLPPLRVTPSLVFASH